MRGESERDLVVDGYRLVLGEERTPEAVAADHNPPLLVPFIIGISHRSASKERRVTRDLRSQRSRVVSGSDNLVHHVPTSPGRAEAAAIPPSGRRHTAL